MVIQAENRLSQLVRVAWELGLAAGNGNLGNEYEVKLNAISIHLQSTGWCSHKGTWSGELQQPKMSWTQVRSSPLFPPDIPYLERSFRWRDLIQKAIDRGSYVSTVLPYGNESNEDLAPPCRLLLHTIVCPDGYVECVAFAKPQQTSSFSELDRAFIAAMLTQLNGTAEQPARDGMEILSKTGLPKRQREVLELLLQGASLKEIASTLRISRHTVNDYSKSLYRHFEVSGRAELAAIFRNSGQLELSHSE